MDYIEELKKRKKESRVYKEYQLVGLLISEVLGDEAHKALYIKLAKEGNPDKLLKLAKSVAERKNVDNKGAYFMRLFHDENTHNRQQKG
jgi:hypothetical protein